MPGLRAVCHNTLTPRLPDGVEYDVYPEALPLLLPPTYTRRPGRVRESRPKRKVPGLQNLIVRGAREHNLKNVTVELPRDKFIVITGVSGSGKSTLAFDTIYAEGQRRYVESLSAYARQFLGLMEKPDVESIEGLSPAISIDQKTTSHNPRSTVGTVTEIHDYLQTALRPHRHAVLPHLRAQDRAPESHRDHRQASGGFEDQRAILLAPLVRGRKGEYRKLFADIRREGFARVRVDGVLYELDEAEKLKLEKFEKHDVDVVIDRLTVRETDRSRIAESVELGLRRGEGLLRVLFPDAQRGAEELYSEKFACPEHGSVLEELEPRSFCFNNPYGACPDCAGLGSKHEFSPDLVIDDDTVHRRGSHPALEQEGHRRRRVLLGQAQGPVRAPGVSTSRRPGAICPRRRRKPFCTAPASRSRWSTAGAARKPCAS